MKFLRIANAVVGVIVLMLWALSGVMAIHNFIVGGDVWGPLAVMFIGFLSFQNQYLFVDLVRKTNPSLRKIAYEQTD